MNQSAKITLNVLAYEPFDTPYQVIFIRRMICPSTTPLHQKARQQVVSQPPCWQQSQIPSRHSPRGTANPPSGAVVVGMVGDETRTASVTTGMNGTRSVCPRLTPPGGTVTMMVWPLYIASKVKPSFKSAGAVISISVGGTGWVSINCDES